MPPLALTFAFCALVPAAGRAADGTPPSPSDAVQMLADVTLIDGECRNVAVNFGRAFQAAAAMGLEPDTIMPTGRLRPAFEAAVRARFAVTTRDDLCTALAKLYADHVPGVLRMR